MGRVNDPGGRVAPIDLRNVAHLIPAARAARVALVRGGRSLSRDALADTMRDDGHGVSNARASLLLKILRAEEKGKPVSSSPGRDDGTDPWRSISNDFGLWLTRRQYHGLLWSTDVIDARHAIAVRIDDSPAAKRHDPYAATTLCERDFAEGAP
jgi:hypothetical protein